ncbi:hypothetical protein SAMD00023353_0100170 [Rosellinia necatrix]|uniref:C2H2-type domain-containing protein n=1 Tax=Rosellinia necatrix TaxID=77044 RepID=A0A1S8A5M5_ROSNE|nr:hypothetical protein SAMD00023353_0100170 [Rosellinia necatrix]
MPSVSSNPDRAPLALHPYLARQKKDCSWPHYDFNKDGEAQVMPWELFCRHEDCQCRKPFRRYSQLRRHLMHKHGLEVSGKSTFH